MRYTLGTDEANQPYPLHDPLEREIRAVLPARATEARHIVMALQGLPGLFPPKLAASAAWVGEVTDALDTVVTQGICQAIRLEASGNGGVSVDR